MGFLDLRLPKLDKKITFAVQARKTAKAAKFLTYSLIINIYTKLLQNV